MNRFWTTPPPRRTILIAGGAGFLGSHLAEGLLAEGHRVIVVDSLLTGRRANIIGFEAHPDFSFIEADITLPLAVEGPVDEIYNLACPASPPLYQADPVHTLMTSVIGTRNLLALAEEKRARFVMASTSEVYGDPAVHPQTEDYCGSVNPTGPRACYDEGKRAAEALCFDTWRARAVDVRVARIFNTYGPRMRPDDGRIISNFIVQALTGNPLTIYGSGEQTRSFCFVSDLIAGLRALMAVPENPGMPVNLGNPGEFTVGDLAALILDMIPSRSEIVHMPLPEDDPRRRQPDISRARDMLGWAPEVSLADGLTRTIPWFAGTIGATDAQLVEPNRGPGVA